MDVAVGTERVRALPALHAPQTAARVHEFRPPAHYFCRRVCWKLEDLLTVFLVSKGVDFFFFVSLGFEMNRTGFVVDLFFGAFGFRWSRNRRLSNAAGSSSEFALFMSVL